jgi:hypothetical protein
MYPISRRKLKRDPVIGHINTLRLSLIPAARFATIFWFIMTLINTSLGFTLIENSQWLWACFVLSVGCGVLCKVHVGEYHRLKQELADTTCITEDPLNQPKEATKQQQK